MKSSANFNEMLLKIVILDINIQNHFCVSRGPPVTISSLKKTHWLKDRKVKNFRKNFKK